MITGAIIALVGVLIGAAITSRNDTEKVQKKDENE